VLRAEAEHHDMLETWINRREARVRKLITEHLEHTLGDLRSALRTNGAGRAAKESPRRAARKPPRRG
jgi:DNA-binding GntR family transcriptional regulator